MLADCGTRGLTFRAVDGQAATPIGTASNYFASRDQMIGQVGVGDGTIDLGLTLAQPAQVGAVENQNALRCAHGDIVPARDRQGSGS